MNSRAERMGERLAKPLLVAALLTIPAIVLDESSVGQPWDTLGRVLNWTIWLAFFAEAALMLSVVGDRWRWIRQHPLAERFLRAQGAERRELEVVERQLAEIIDRLDAMEAVR